MTRARGAAGPKGVGFIMVAVSAAAFGTLAILASFAYRGGATVLGVVVLRFGITALLFWGALVFRRLPAWPKGLWQLWLLGGMLYALQSVLFLAAVEYTSPALAALLFYVYPVLVVVLAALSGQGAITRTGMMGLASSVLGLVLVLGLSRSGFTWVGALLGLGTAVVYSVYIVFGQTVIERHDPIVATAHIALSATVTLGVVGVITGALDYHRFGPTGFAASVLIGIIPGALAIFMFLAGLRRIGAARAAMLSMLEPVVTVVLSAAVLGEGLTPPQVLGGTAVVAGALASMLPGASQGPPAERDRQVGAV